MFILLATHFYFVFLAHTIRANAYFTFPLLSLPLPRPITDPIKEHFPSSLNKCSAPLMADG